MDGTIYLGNRIFECTPPFFRRLAAAGARHIFLTNNSSKSAEMYLQKLNSMGIPVQDGGLITSTHATARYLKKYGNLPIYVSGTKDFCKELAELGVNVSQDMSNPAALVMGYDTELNFQKLENMCKLLNSGIDYIASNPDLTCPTEYGYVPDCGSVAQILNNATGREPIFIGKPAPDMIEMALERFQIPKEDAIIIGDRLFTDIACGIAAGVETALVLTGESTEADIKNSPHKPDFVFRDLSEVDL